MFYKVIRSIIVISLLVSIPTLYAQESIHEITEFGSNPGNLKMFQYQPKAFKTKRPLVVVLHGCIQNAEEMAKLTGWNKLADEHDFSIVYPQQNQLNNLQNCFNWFQPDDVTKDKGEVASIKQMIDFAIAKNTVDTDRIFVVGISAGGAMASALMALYPETFKAGAIMSGIAYGAATNLMTGLSAMQGNIKKSGQEWSELIKQQHPSYEGNYPKVAVFHGSDDPAVKETNAEEIVKQWTTVHQIDTVPKIIKRFSNNDDVTAYYYGKKKNKQTVIRYSIHNLGHALAVDPGKNLKQGGTISKYAIDKDFHSSYWAACFFGLIK